MKTRAGFVSNSSSSSFVCIGVRFKAEDSQFYKDESDKFFEIIDDSGAHYDAEMSDGYVYYGLSKLIDDEDWSFEKVGAFDEMRGEGLDKAFNRLVAESTTLFDVKPAKVETGMWIGRIAT